MIGAMLGILISVTPLAPIFRLLSFVFSPSAMMLDVNSNGFSNVTEQINNIMHQILTNETLDIEKLLLSVLGPDFHKVQQHSRKGSSLFVRSPSFPRTYHTTWEDLREVIPWILSLILFVIVPVIMKVSQAVRYRGLGRQFNERKQRSITKAVIEQCLKMSRRVCSVSP